MFHILLLIGLLNADLSPQEQAEHALARFECTWRPAADPRARLMNHSGWRIHLTALRDVLKAGPDGIPVLRAALKSKSAATRSFAAQALALLDAPEAVRKELLEYDLKRLNTARIDQAAPEFTLLGDDGKPHRLSDARGKKHVILIFLLEQR